jgi:FkbM family methyltransferase
MTSWWRQRAKAALGPYGWARRSFAQEGEDIVLDRLFEGRRSGFYVEVGCHHPFRFSNSYYFYSRGWRGVCIDALPGTQRLFRRWRKRDIVVESGIASRRGELTYYMFDEPALNTFDAALVQERLERTRYKLIRSVQVPTDTLAAILAAHCPVGQQIDFLSVDVEGLDLEVLESNDWDRYRPLTVVAECLQSTLAHISDDPVACYLTERGYAPYAKTGNSVIFTGKAP